MPDVNGEVEEQEELETEEAGTTETESAPEKTGDDKVDHRGVPWRNVAAEAARKLEKARTEAAEARSNYEQLEAALKDRPEILRALLEGTPLPTQQPGQEDDGLDPETRRLLDRPQDLLKYLAREVKGVKQLALAGQHVQSQAQEQAAWQQFHWAIAHFMGEAGLDPQNATLRTRISDLVVADLNRRNSAGRRVNGPDELREVFQGVLSDVNLTPPKGAKQKTTTSVPPSTTRGGGPPQRQEPEVNLASPDVTKALLAKILREAEGVPLE